MGRVLAVDFGLKRVGLAVSDPLKMIAGPLAVLSPQQTLPFLDDYLRREQVEVLVVGLPLDLKGRPNSIQPQLEQFVQQVQQRFPYLKIVWLDERFSSQMAQRLLAQAGLPKGKRRQKESIDQVSAILILQQFLEKQLK
ncbi:MAG: Holliday junction resolvase RuvX [Chitinophagales bacterium]|nr:Holliday junction resolvase RuvX [Chitinophagales bacterium]MDW8428476.1 Holliday junction resolvase RuvX [Chitinophagales bacterium]